MKICIAICCLLAPVTNEPQWFFFFALTDLLRDGEVLEGRAKATIVQKIAHRAGHGAVESLQGAANLVDGHNGDAQLAIRAND